MGAAESIGGNTGPFREFQVFAKPVGPLCNLACSYCYYLNKKQLYAGVIARMTDAMLDTYVRQHFEATTGHTVIFSWHGGEPMLAGLDFYRKVVDLQQKYCNRGKKVINGIQTNAVLMDDKWCRFLADAGFLVGISIDGPEALHNLSRKTRDGEDTFAKVLQGYDRLVMHGIDPEILCVVNAYNARYPLELYRFFRHLGAPFLTFIPLVEPLSGKHTASERSVGAEAFGNFLCAVFDEWLAQDIGKVKVQLFEEALRTAFGQEHTLCIFKPVCGGVPVVEHNGDFYSCDHFVLEEHRVGNIRQCSLAELLDSKKQKAFGQAKLKTLPEYCRICEVRDMCNGECPKNRFISTPAGEPGLNYLCAGYKKFFNHCRPFVEAVAKAWQHGNKKDP